jgi:hypothetical protein
MASIRSLSAARAAIADGKVFIDNKGKAVGAPIAPATLRDLVKSGTVRINGASRSVTTDGRSVRRLTLS